ncbi:Aminomethyltransferase [Mycobacteroides abscessus subsp. bolletii]|nr:Aminomethyltransferase [Mycobacteroides abscessus subsp. bolletii]SKH12945.1 Aminomethyltransferase [Mycobacteroides abscessus subsp. bolletii]
MSDTFIEGPDATRLLAAVSANAYESFADGQAKQFIAVASDGNIVGDGILTRNGAENYILTGNPPAQNWVKYHAGNDSYDVSLVTDPETSARAVGDPRLFRYQIQGPLACDLAERTFGGPLPPVKFFHSVPVTLAGRTFRALRHNMAGQDGYEFIGAWEDGAAVKEALLAAGEPLGLVQVGALAYPTAAVESGWIPVPIPAVYTDPGLAGYRQSVSLYS